MDAEAARGQRYIPRIPHESAKDRSASPVPPTMILSTSELVASLQTEVRIVLHLVSKVDADALDYRPTPGQRSTLELVRYLSMMGPAIVRYALASPPDIAIWTKAEEASLGLTLDQAVARIAEHSEEYAALLGSVPDEKYREAFIDFDGKQTTVGAFIVNLVLCGCAAYRTQLFLYLKASGQASLNSMNLWSGADAAAPAA